MADKFEPRKMEVRNAMKAQTVTEAVNTRRSIRVFTDEVVPQQDIAKLLELSARAPSGGNVQPWKVYVLGPTKRDELVESVSARIAAKQFEAEGPLPRPTGHPPPHHGHSPRAALICPGVPNLPCQDGGVGRRPRALHGLPPHPRLPDVRHHGRGARRPPGPRSRDEPELRVLWGAGAAHRDAGQGDGATPVVGRRHVHADLHAACP